ncbi:MAG: carboxy terminal-processing peptidase [Bacteroidetes bacterium]|nr:carboxy terminal-processing peptidase [Bacteroidota bacterium]
MKLLLLLYFFNQGGLKTDTLPLSPSAVNGKEAKVVVSLLQRFHYRKTVFSDSLSSVFFDAYFKTLDPSKSYFLESDIKAFESYRYRLDNLIQQEDVGMAYSVYKIFRKRFITRMDQILNQLINEKYDYSKDEFYDSDREKASWAKSPEELDRLWYQIVKSQALSLRLSGKKDEEIASTLKTRFERYRRSVVQFNSEDVFASYLNSLTESFDPHTNYLSPKASDLFKQNMSLSLEGIGARLQTDNDYTKVFEIVPGGPADKSGKMHPNDLITAVGQGDEGELVDIIGWRVDDVVKLIKGPKGTIVRLQIIPAASGVNGPTEIIKLERDKIKLEDQAAKKEIVQVGQGSQVAKLGVIKLPGFYMDFDAYNRRDPNYRSTTRDVRKLIDECKVEGVSGLVIDLRNNGGGSLNEAIDLTGLFIKEGPVVQVRSSDSRVETGVDDDPGVAWEGPLVVLTNRFSASASEIFAGAIQDYKRGIVFGESTFGKGTVQQVINLRRMISSPEPVGDLKVTFQKFYRVSGSSTQHKGVTPDILLKGAYDADKFGESANQSALPWDQIPSAAYDLTNAVNDKLLGQLRKSFNERLKSDQALKQYLSETDELRENINQTKASLNEAERKKQADETEKKKAQNSLDTRISGKDGAPDPLKDLKDEFLREGLLILSEMLTRKIG